MADEPIFLPENALSPAQIAHFEEHGHLVVREAFSYEEAHRLVRATFHDRDPKPWISRTVNGASVESPLDGIDLEDPTTWPRTSLNLHTGRELPIETFAPKLWAAIESLIGARAVRRRTMGQLLKVNADFHAGPAPALDSPLRLRGWHIDAPRPPTTLENRTDALVLLALWSDIDPDGGGTRYRPRTLDLLLRALERHEEGIDVEGNEFVSLLNSTRDEVIEVTGRAGDVVITHPFVFHSRSRNYGERIRIIENTMISVEVPLDYDRDNAAPSPVERCVIRRLGKPRRGKRPSTHGAAERMIESGPSYFWPVRTPQMSLSSAAIEERAALDHALTHAWIQQVVSQLSRTRGGPTHIAGSCASAIRQALMRPNARRLEVLDDPQRPFAALLSGLAGPRTTRRLLAWLLTEAGLSTEVCSDQPVRVRDGDRWLIVQPHHQPSVDEQPTLSAGSDAAYRVFEAPALRSLRELASTPLGRLDERGLDPAFEAYLRVRLAHLTSSVDEPRAAYQALVKQAGPITKTLISWFGTPPSERGSAGDRADAFVARVQPVPGWLAEITGVAAPDDVRLASKKGRMHLSVRAGDRERRFVIDRANGVIVEARPSGPGAPASLGVHTDRFTRLYRLLHYIGALFAGGAPGEHAPSPTQAGYAALFPWAASNGRRPAQTGIEAVDRFAEEVEVFRALTAGRMQRLFERADAELPEAPWARALLLVLSGDVQRLSEIAYDARREGSPLDVLTGRVLDWARFDRAAYAFLEAGLEATQPQGRADVLLPLAEIAVRLEDRDAALRAVRAAIVARANDVRFLRRGTTFLVNIGCIEDAYLVLSDAVKTFPNDAELSISLGEIYAFAGDYTRAREIADGIRGAEDNERLEKLRAIVDFGEGRFEEARGGFERAAKGSLRAECELFLAEIHYRLGDLERARGYLETSRLRSQTVAHTLLTFLIHRDESGPKLRAVHAIFAAEDADLAARGTGAAATSCLDGLARLRGNRTERLTWAPGAERVSPIALRPVRVPIDDHVLASRNAASDAMKMIATDPQRIVFATMDDLVRRYPTSPHPYCYRGELRLWLGDYEGAHQDFVDAEHHQKARWAYVGRAAVYVMRGEYERAEQELARCATQFDPVPGATTHVYLGELHLRLGRFDDAIRELERAVAAKPGRVAAWMNLALAHVRRGAERSEGGGAASDGGPPTRGEDEARAIFERVLAAVPRLFWDVRRSLDPAPPWPIPFDDMERVFARAFEMMQGNRSSHLITYYDHEGTFRVARDVRELAQQVQKWRFLFAEEVACRVLREGPWD